MNINSEKELVWQMQKMMQTLSYRNDDASYRVAPDGNFDEGTKNALICFQEKFRLEPTGEADFETWEMLRLEYLKSEEAHGRRNGIFPFPALGGFTVGKGERSDLVLIIQLMLDELRKRHTVYGYIPPNGYFGNSTEDAIKKLQAVYGLEATGEVDGTTWDRMALEYNTMVNRERE